MKQFHFKFKKRGGGKSPNNSHSMVLLDHTGKPQMYMKGGELIISRKETKKIIDIASNMQTNSSEDAFYELGKYMYNVRMAQRKRDGY